LCPVAYRSCPQPSVELHLQNRSPNHNPHTRGRRVIGAVTNLPGLTRENLLLASTKFATSGPIRGNTPIGSVLLFSLPTLACTREASRFKLGIVLRFNPDPAAILPRHWRVTRPGTLSDLSPCMSHSPPGNLAHELVPILWLDAYYDTWYLWWPYQDEMSPRMCLVVGLSEPLFSPPSYYNSCYFFFYYYLPRQACSTFTVR
jgi:hypothetical protein